jgi:hypothetical protein
VAAAGAEVPPELARLQASLEQREARPETGKGSARRKRRSGQG